MAFYEPSREQISTHSNQRTQTICVNTQQELAELFGKGIGLGHYLQNLSAWINSDINCSALIKQISTL